MKTVLCSTTIVTLATIVAISAIAQNACGQQGGIQWRNNLAAAQSEAEQTGKPILLHFWTPTCGPCKRLEATVFNQASVAQAIENQFIPVKINAEAQPNIARQYAVFQWPTDVVTTPQGHAIGKMVSPPTPTAYISQISQVANRFNTQLGAGFERAVANASQPSRLNNAYAGLSFSAPETAAPQATPTQSSAPVSVPPTSPYAAATASTPVARYQPAAQPVTQDRYAAASLAATQATVAPSTPIANTTPTTAITPTVSTPSRINNPYVQAATQTPVAASQVAPPISPNATASVQSATPQGAPIQNVAAQPITPIPPQATAQAAPQNPPLGFDGYCPVSMKKEWNWVKGDANWGIVHRGRTYLFKGQAERDEFWQNPDQYSPALSGNDPVTAIDRGQAVEGSREHSLEYGGLFYMFESEASLQQFSASPARYVAGVRQAMGLDAQQTIRR